MQGAAQLTLMAPTAEVLCMRDLAVVIQPALSFNTSHPPLSIAWHGMGWRQAASRNGHTAGLYVCECERADLGDGHDRWTADASHGH